MLTDLSHAHWRAVNRAFTKQSAIYDEADEQNRVLSDLRRQVYDHVSRFLKNPSEILELNAGTGIDAVHFVKQGHNVLATDLSDGMVARIAAKIDALSLHGRLSCEQVSYDGIDRFYGRRFDFVFSNFGGLNCIADLSRVTRHLPDLLRPGGFVTWVIMPRVHLWEIAGIFKGHGKKALRRLRPHGVVSHLEGEYFTTYYHSLSRIRSAFPESFQLVSCEGLAAISPPPHREDFPVRYPVFYKTLRNIDRRVRKHFPFNRWADHLIVTFQYRP